MENLNGKKILIVRLSSIGDTVHGLPVLASIKDSYPMSKVSWVVEKRSSSLVVNNPLLEKVYIIDREAIKNEKSIIKRLKCICSIIFQIQEEKFDIAIDLQGLFKSGIIAFFSKAPKRIGFKNTREFADIFLTDKINVGEIFSTSEHIIEKNLKLIKNVVNDSSKIEYPLPEVTDETIDRVNNLIQKNNNKLNVGIICATLWKSKHWINSYWEKVIQCLSHSNNIYMIGSHNDMKLINQITQNIPEDQYINIVGKTSLLDLIEVFKRMDIIIGVDTGPIHIAAAVQKPKIIGIYGSTSPIRTGAYRHLNLISNVKCQPCNKKICPLGDERYMHCMKNLSADVIISEFNRIAKEL